MSNPAQATLSFPCISGVDIAAKDFTVAIILNGSKAKLEPAPFKQEAEGFARFIARLQATGLPPQQHLIVMEATGPYWVALAVALAHASYNVSVINPAQVHYLPKPSSNGLNPISWMLKLWPNSLRQGPSNSGTHRPNSI